MVDKLNVVAVNLRRRWALLTNDTLRPITNLFAAGGFDTDDPAKALSCVVKVSETHWITLDLRDYPAAPLQ